MIVVDVDTGAEREVVRACKVCKADPSAPMVVSPAGVAHESRDYGVTPDCGHDATGPEWWWRE